MSNVSLISRLPYIYWKRNAEWTSSLILGAKRKQGVRRNISQVVDTVESQHAQLNFIYSSGRLLYSLRKPFEFVRIGWAYSARPVLARRQTSLLPVLSTFPTIATPEPAAAARFHTDSLGSRWVGLLWHLNVLRNSRAVNTGIGLLLTTGIA